VNCVGSWGPWGTCNCQTVTESQTFIVTVPAVNNGTACTATNGQTLNRTCVVNNCPVDCVGSWGNPSACDCITNTSSVVYTIFVQPLNGGAQCPFNSNQTNIMNCILTGCKPVNCVGAWSVWSNCSCITNTSIEAFVITTPASNGGKPCNPSTAQTKSKSCVCGSNGIKNSDDWWKIVLIVLGSVLAAMLVGAVVYGTFMVSESNGFEAV